MTLYQKSYTSLILTDIDGIIKAAGYITGDTLPHAY